MITFIVMNNQSLEESKMETQSEYTGGMLPKKESKNSDLSDRDRFVLKITLWLCAITCAFFWFKIVFF